jgi:target of rapamycin complex subunit LST8
LDWYLVCYRICSRIIKYPDSQVNRLQITPDKQFIAAAGNPHIRLYEILNGSSPVDSGGVDPPTQQPVLTLEGHTAAVTAIGFQKDGRYLYSGSEDGTIKVSND